MEVDISLCSRVLLPTRKRGAIAVVVKDKGRGFVGDMILLCSIAVALPKRRALGE
jgi:hypothetical protein